MDVAALADSDDDHFEVDSVLGGPRENTLTLVTLQSPAPAVSALAVRVEVGPSVVSPVFMIIQIRNQDSGIFEGISFSVVSETVDSVINIGSVSNPNAYIDGTGKVELRIGQTARAPQIPGGFTKLIDHVQLTVFE